MIGKRSSLEKSIEKQTSSFNNAIPFQLRFTTDDDINLKTFCDNINAIKM